MKPRLLDLFCGAGGCSMGYHREGFDVVGVDINPQKNYPFPFIQMDAMEAMRRLLAGEGLLASDGRTYYLKDFAVIHASPPCQAYSRSRNNGCHKDAPRLIEPTRKLLKKSGLLYVIENVENAPLINPVLICGHQFGLHTGQWQLPRHRIFESNVSLKSEPCTHTRGMTIGVYGNGTNKWHREKFGRCILEKKKREAMGIDWMTRKELTQAIPPAYCEFIGRQLMRIL